MSNLRTRQLKKVDNNTSQGPVLYWMQRAQRVQDNWSLIEALQFANCNNKSLVIVFNLFPEFLDATIRQFDFMLRGLQETAADLTNLNISFTVLYGDPVHNLTSFISQNQISALFTDFNPLKLIASTKSKLINQINIPVFEVDSSNIIPVWIASPKLEFAAYTLRPKIKKLLPDFLTDFPHLTVQKTPMPTITFKGLIAVTPLEGLEMLKVDRSVKPVTWLKPGPKAALEQLNFFIQNSLDNYSLDRNNPNLDGVSHMSPYLHYGQISAQRVALNVKSALNANTDSKEAYLEELIVRRELADNYCYYCSNYDNLAGVHEWAKKTLNEHRFDKREYLYTLDQFENCQTHDPLWNAAQTQLSQTGKMHGFMRMYWAKKILEWTPTPEEAQQIAIYLNDKYELDGIDPNGYTGIAWSIGGVHDRAWNERAVFGKIRFMNYNGCKRKFDVASYQEQWGQSNQTTLL